MTVNNFIPAIWSASIFQDFDTRTVLAPLCNRNYEGEIQGAGDRVKINAVGPITINTYTKNSTSSITVQKLTDSQTELVVDQQKYFAFELDDVDAAQTKGGVMQEATRKGGIAVAKDVDSFIASLYTQAGASTYMSLTVASTDYGFLNMVGRAEQLLDEMDAPMEGRFAVISPYVNAQIAKQASYLTQGNSQAFTAGYLGRLMGFDIYMSNNLATGSTHTASQPVHECLFGTRDAITFANQILKTEAYRDPNTFGDIVRGLNVYGGKVVQPKALVCIETRST